MPDFSVIPSIEQLRQRPAVRALEARFGTEATVDALRAAAAQVRSAIADPPAKEAFTDANVVDHITAGAAAHLNAAFRPSLVEVINATGVVLHTNLGRAPLASA